MRGDLKLVLTGTAPPELFNVLTDPGERRNVAAEHPELVKEMRKGITDWLRISPGGSSEGLPFSEKSRRSTSHDCAKYCTSEAMRNAPPPCSDAVGSVSAINRGASLFFCRTERGWFPPAERSRERAATGGTQWKVSRKR